MGIRFDSIRCEDKLAIRTVATYTTEVDGGPSQASGMDEWRTTFACYSRYEKGIIGLYNTCSNKVGSRIIALTL